MPFKLPEVLYGPVCTTLSIGLSSLLLFVAVFVDWFNVRMAVLAPIVSCLCYASSLSSIVAKSTRMFSGILVGGVFCVIWLLILRGVSAAVTGTKDYDQYIAVACATPWLIGFHMLLPRRIVSLSTATLIFLTMTMYCGDDEAPDAFPLRAILCGCCGGLIPIGVAYLVDRFSMNHTRDYPELTYAESLLWRYWDLLLEEAVIPGSLPELEARRSAFVNGLSSKHITPKIGESFMRAFSALSSIHSVLSNRSRQGFLPGEICSALTELSSRRISSKPRLRYSIDKLQALTTESIDSGPRSILTLKVYLITGLMQDFLMAIDSVREEAPINSKWSLKTYCKDSFKSVRLSWVSFLHAMRFTCIMVGLSELLVFWDARDETVDTYALWAFVPTLLLAEQVMFVGQAVRQGLLYTLGAIVGSALGVVSLLANSGNRTSFIAEFILVGILGFTIQVRKPNWADTGIVLIVSWIICVLGNFGLDPAENNGGSDASGGGLNILWRVALYRSAITCFSVFVMALFFILIPTNFANKSLENEAINFASSMARIASGEPTDCVTNSHSSSSGNGHNDRDKIEEPSYPIYSMHVFASSVYPAQQRFAEAELMSRRFSVIDSKLIQEVWSAFSSVLGVLNQSSKSYESFSCCIKPITVLQEAIRGVMKELEPLSTPSGLRNADTSLVKPRARQLREAINLAKRWLLTGEYTAELIESEGIVSSFLLGICLVDFLKRWIVLERQFGLHEDMEGFPTNLNDTDEVEDLESFNV